MKKKILIVDDNPDLFYIVKKGLKRLMDGCMVTGANGGKECFE